MKFGNGESRTLIVRHPDGLSFEANLTKPKEWVDGVHLDWRF